MRVGEPNRRPPGLSRRVSITDSALDRILLLEILPPRRRGFVYFIGFIDTVVQALFQIPSRARPHVAYAIKRRLENANICEEVAGCLRRVRPSLDVVTDCLTAFLSLSERLLKGNKIRGIGPLVVVKSNNSYSRAR